MSDMSTLGRCLETIRELRERNEAGGNDGGECREHGGKKQETNGGRGW